MVRIARPKVPQWVNARVFHLHSGCLITYMMPSLPHAALIKALGMPRTPSDLEVELDTVGFIQGPSFSLQIAQTWRRIFRLRYPHSIHGSSP